MDALAPGIGEIIGGSQREERLEILDRSMVERGIDREHLCLAAICAAMARCRRPSLTLPRLRGGRGGGLRAHPRLRHRPCQRARRDPLPANPRQREIL